MTYVAVPATSKAVSSTRYQQPYAHHVHKDFCYLLVPWMIDCSTLLASAKKKKTSRTCGDNAMFPTRGHRHTGLSAVLDDDGGA